MAVLRYIDGNGTERTKLTWSAPTENTDGSSITQSLTYNLYKDFNGTPEAVSSFPGFLNPDSEYEFPLADVAAVQEGDNLLYLTAVDEDGDESDFSNSLLVVGNVIVIPGKPVNFSLA